MKKITHNRNKTRASGKRITLTDRRVSDLCKLHSVDGNDLLAVIAMLRGIYAVNGIRYQEFRSTLGASHGLWELWIQRRLPVGHDFVFEARREGGLK